jgi:hypothetical protein
MLSNHPKYCLLVNGNGLTTSSKLLMRLNKEDRELEKAIAEKRWYKRRRETTEDRVYRTLSLTYITRCRVPYDWPENATWSEIANSALWERTYFQQRLAVDLGLATEIPFNHPAHERYEETHPNGIMKTAPRAEQMQEVA